MKAFGPALDALDRNAWFDTLDARGRVSNLLVPQITQADSRMTLLCLCLFHPRKRPLGKLLRRLPYQRTVLVERCANQVNTCVELGAVLAFFNVPPIARAAEWTARGPRQLIAKKRGGR